MQRCSMPLVIGKCKLKLQLHGTTHLLEHLKLKTDHNKSWHVEELELTITTLLVVTYNGTATQERVWHFIRKLNIHISQSSAILLPAISPREKKAYVHTKTCTQMLITALFLIAKNWKQPKFSSTGEWVNKLQCIHTTEHYSAIKKK